MTEPQGGSVNPNGNHQSATPSTDQNQQPQPPQQYPPYMQQQPPYPMQQPTYPPQPLPYGQAPYQPSSYPQQAPQPGTPQPIYQQQITGQPPHPMYQQPYPPQPGPYQHHAVAKHKPQWWIIAIIIAAVVALVAGGLFAAYQFMGGNNVPLPSAEQAYADVPKDQYELRDPITVDTYHEFRITLKNPAKVQGDKLEGTEVAVDDTAKVYQDASLSVPIPVSAFAGMPIDDKDGSGTIDVGGLMDIPEYMQHGDKIGAEHGFLPSDGYYYVQYMGEDGKRLAKPIVQFFMVKDPTNSAQLAAVRGVKPTINATGGVDLSWKAVEGAKSYNVYTYITQSAIGTPGSDDYTEATSTITKIGSSTKTTLLSDDYDKPDHEKKKTGLDDVDNAVLDQNYALQSLARYTQDQLDSCKNDTSEYCADIMKETGGTWSPSLAGKLYFVVMAVDENKHEGRWRATDANDIVPSIPVGVAQQAQLNQWAYGLKGVFGEDNTIEEDMQAYVYTFVQMADGATVPVPSKFSDLKPTGKPNSWHFTYSAPGTKISDSANLWYEGDLTAEFPRITQAAIQALPKAAGLDTRVVTGSVSSSKASHAWNYVSIDGQWLLMDATWDDAGDTASDRYQLKDPSQVGDHFAFSRGWTLSSQIAKN